MSPAVSVIMLAYNRPQFMRIAVESVLNQTFRDFELLILDNGSSDKEVFNIAKEYADKDSRVHASRVADGLCISLGRNKQLQQAQAEYVAVIDDDDFWALNKLEKQVDFMRKNPNVCLYACSFALINEKGEPHPNKEKILNDSINPPTRDVEVLSSIDDNFCGPNQMFRRDALLAIGGWRPYFFLQGDDMDLFFRLQEKYSYASTSEKLASYRYQTTKGKSDYEQLSARPGGVFQNHMSFLSAFYRRQGKQDPINDSLNTEEFIADNMLTIMNIKKNWSAKYTRGHVKWMLRYRHYGALRKFIRGYHQSNAPQKGKMYLNLLAWSVWYGRLGYWFRF